MPAGNDDGHGREPVVYRLLGEKDAALGRARDAGLTVLEGRYAVQKYRGDSTDPSDLYEVLELEPNLFLTVGINTILKLAAGQGGTAYGTNTRLAVGDNSPAFAAAASDTDLRGTNKFRQVVDSTPVVSTNQITFVATFATGVANFAWAEVGVVNAGTGGEMWSRTVQNLGTKVSAATWILNWTLSIS